MARMTRLKAEARMHKDKHATDPEWSIEDTGTSEVRLVQKKRTGGFDPYQGAISERPPSRKRDLRKIDEWLKARRRAEQLKREDSE